jgi:hypothetical protein
MHWNYWKRKLACKPKRDIVSVVSISSRENTINMVNEYPPKQNDGAGFIKEFQVSK